MPKCMFFYYEMSYFRYINFFLRRVKSLQQNGVDPIIVFDGCPLPKNNEKTKRDKTREKYLAKAQSGGGSTSANQYKKALKATPESEGSESEGSKSKGSESEGSKSEGGSAYAKQLKKALKITPSMAHEVIKVLKQEEVPFIVAPYEADAEIAFLAIHGLVDVVYTSDTDLILFGCPRIIFEMTGWKTLVEFRESNLLEMLNGLTRQMFFEACLFCGCDYLKSLNMDHKTAIRMLTDYKTYAKVIEYLKENNKYGIYPGYETEYLKAMLMYTNQRVYDPFCKSIRLLSGSSEDDLRCRLPKDVADDLSFLGPCIPNELAQGIAEGVIHPVDRVPFE